MALFNYEHWTTSGSAPRFTMYHLGLTILWLAFLTDYIGIIFKCFPTFISLDILIFWIIIGYISARYPLLWTWEPVSTIFSWIDCSNQSSLSQDNLDRNYKVSACLGHLFRQWNGIWSLPGWVSSNGREINTIQFENVLGAINSLSSISHLVTLLWVDYHYVYQHDRRSWP